MKHLVDQEAVVRDTPSPTQKGKQRTRSQQACQNCRALKARCVPSDVPGKCQKCFKSDIECKPHVPKPQSQRRKRTVRSLATMEAKIQELYQLVGDTNISQERSGSIDQTSDISNLSPNDTAGNDLQRILCEILDSVDVYSGSRWLPTLGYDTGTVLLDRFRSKIVNFPFVFIPEETSVEDLVRSRPILALVVFIVVTCSDVEMQSEMETLFQKTIAQMILIDGDRTLELVQALLVYVAWQHYYMKDDKQHTYIYLNTVIAICIDMGFHKPNPRAWNETSLISVANDTSYESLLECRRAYLGCYYLSCGLSTLGFNKPQTVVYDDHVQRIATELGERGNALTDRYIPAMVELMHIAEMHDGFIRSQVHEQSNMSSEQPDLRLAMNHAEQRLNQWDTDFAAIIPESPWLQYTRAFILIHFYAKGFLAADPQDFVPQNHPYSFTRLSMLLLCFEEIKHLLDAYLQSARPIVELGFVEWSHLITSLVIMCRLVRPLRLMQSQDVDKIDTYIDKFTRRFALETNDCETQDQTTPLHAWVTRIVGYLKHWVRNGGVPSCNRNRYDETAFDQDPYAEALRAASRITSFEPGAKPSSHRRRAGQSQLQEEPQTSISFGPDPSLATSDWTGGLTASPLEMGEDFWNGFIWDWPNMQPQHSLPTTSSY